MSENITIQEGGVAKNLNAVKKLETNLQGGGTCLWIPEDDIELGDKTIKKNGTYYAKTDSLTGYAKVYVNVPGGKSKTDNNGNLLDDDGDTVDEDGNKTKDSGKDPVKPKPSSGGDGDSEGSNPGVVGKDPDDGNEYHVKTDPTTGDLIRTKIPSSIKVTKNPNKTSYQDGDTLDPSGIVVHKYYGDGGDAGTVLNSELTYDPMALTGGSNDGRIDGYSPIGVGWTYNNKAQPPVVFIPLGGTGEITIAAQGHNTGEGYDWTLAYSNADALIMCRGGGYGTDACFIGSNPNVRVVSSTYNPSNPAYNIRIYNPVTNGGYKAQTVVNANYSWSEIQFPYNNGIPLTYSDNYQYMQDFLALYYGNDQRYVHVGTDITVKWHRPVDGKELTDTFDVSVSGGSSNDSGGGGSTGF